MPDEYKKVIVEVEYDTDEAVKSLKDLTDEIVENEKKQKALKDAYKEGTITQEQYSQALAENQEIIKKGKSERANLIKQLQSEAGSVDKLKAEITDLTKKRNKLNQDTKEGKEKAQEYNKQLKQMKGALKEAQSGTKEAGNAFGRLKEDLEGLPHPIGNIVSGIGGMTKAALKFIATPFGAILAAIVFVVQQMIKAFKRSESRMVALRAVGARLSGVFKGFQKVLEPLVDFLVNNVIVAFEKLSNVADKAVRLISRGLRKMGFEKAAENVDNFIDKIEETSRAAEELAKMEGELTKELRRQERVQLEYQKLAEKQRQIRDDESLSIEERIAANERLGQVLKEQLQEELRIANLALAVADKRIEVDGETTEALDARAEALTKIAEIEERIVGQESEQLVNINALLKEKAELEEKAAEEARKRIEAELEAEKKKFEEMTKRRESALTQLEKYNEDRLLKMEEDLEKRKELEIEFENEDYERKLENETLLAEEIELIKVEHTRRLSEIDEEYKQLRIQKEREALSETMKAIDEIADASGALKDERIQYQAELFNSAVKFNNLEIQSEAEKMDTFANFTMQLTSLINRNHAAQLSDLQAQKEAELALAGDNTVLREEIDRKYAQMTADLKEKQFNEDKVKALIDTSINTAVAVTKFLAMGNVPGSIAAGVTGGIQAALIASKKFKPETYERGGKLALFGGPSHHMGGTHLFGTDGTHLEVEGGESAFVLNRDATAEIAALSAINETFGGKAMTSKGAYLQKGGQAVPEVFNYDALAEAMSNVNIVTKIESVKTGLSKYDEVIENGIV